MPFALAGTGCAHTQTVAAAPQLASAPAAAREAGPAAPALAAVLSEDNDRDLEALLRGDVLHFDYDRAQLEPDSLTRLRALAQLLSQHPQLAIRIEGNCDERGTEDYNLQLGQERADAARRYLQELGVDPSRIAT